MYWISVEDKLPTKSPIYGPTEDLLVCLDDGVVQPSSYCSLGFANIRGARERKVTHWMPMPAPVGAGCESEEGRGLVCMFCGEGFGYAGSTPDEATLRAAVHHEKECVKNPYKAEITRLRGVMEDCVAGHDDCCNYVCNKIKEALAQSV